MRRADQEIEEEVTERVIDHQIRTRRMRSPNRNHQGVQGAIQGSQVIKNSLKNEKYDMILMDHMMPDMDGVETLHAVRALGGQCAELPIVLLTANVVSGVKETMLKEGFDGFLSKPIDIEELKETLAKFLGTEE